MILLKLHAALLVLTLSLGDYVHDTLCRWRDDEDGLTTTEIAVVTFLLVGAAIVVMGIIYAAAKNMAENIPVPDAPAQ